jgi:hypothetical protein
VRQLWPLLQSESDAALARVSRAEEGSEAACNCSHDEDRPELEADVDDLAARRERVLDLRRDSQQLHGGEECGVAEAETVPTVKTTTDNTTASV